MVSETDRGSNSDMSGRTEESSFIENDDEHDYELSPLLNRSQGTSYQNQDEHHDDSLQEQDPIQQSENSTGGSASLNETVTNLSKACLGSGCLALPYAANQGGILLYVFGIFAIATWNYYSTICLCQSEELISRLEHGKDHQQQLPLEISDISTKSSSTKEDSTLSLSSSIIQQHHPPPPDGTSKLGILAWYAIGKPGLILLDVMMVLLLFGIIVAYDDAIREFLRQTPFTTNSNVYDAILLALIIAPMTLVKDMGKLAKISAAGLFVLAVTLVVIAGYGIVEYDDYVDPSVSAFRWLPLDGIAGASNFFGCTVFGFGFVPLTFNFRDSMQTPTRYPKAVITTLVSVSILFYIIGLGLLFLYPNVPGDVLSEIPQEGVLPILTRVAMAIVVVSTTPLLVVPCAEIIEGKITKSSSTTRTEEETKTMLPVMVRFGICFFTCALSVGIPEFVNALTLVGCLCVGFVSYCIPPFLYVILQRKHGHPISHLLFDVLMFFLGVTATTISTAYTFTKVIAR